VATRLEYLELDDEGVMEVPVDPSRAGWFSPSPAPGVPGSSVIAGHVTWDREPAVFFDLGRLAPGDTIDVDRADGTKPVFVVQRTGTFPKAALPTRAVYRQIDYPGLRLITCGGRYNDQTGNYDANLIVWARLVS
ncbi:MAG TPA: sortase, partial [Nocardioidaceae bacterium]|nr:sortase [Nocardioidaceae bacterium]